MRRFVLVAAFVVAGIVASNAHAQTGIRTLIFYPTTAGTAGQCWVSSGAGVAPAWASCGANSIGNSYFAVSGPATSTKTFTFPNASATVLTDNALVTAAQGGTGNGFFAVSGPASSTKTFTFPNASATVLTTNALVTAAQGGTGNGFFAVSGPATSTKTFTFPNANATVLTDNALVTAAQGGTGNGFFAVSGPASTTKTFTFPNASATVLTEGAAIGGVTPAAGTFTTLTANTQLIGHGTATNDSAAAGYVGEIISSQVTSGSAVSDTGNLQWVTVTSIALTAGDWDVSLIAQATLNGATATLFQAGIGTVDGNDGTGVTPGVSGFETLPPTTAADVVGTVPPYRVSLAGSATYYFKARAAYSANGPVKFYGRISARRVR